MKIEKELDFIYETAVLVELAFYKAFGCGDFVLMESLYADHGVSCTHPGGCAIVGRKKVIDNWKFVLEGIPKATIDIEILGISKGKDVQVHQVLETFVIDELNGIKSEVYTTNVYILQKNGWRLQMQHASVAERKIMDPNHGLYKLQTISLQENTMVN